ncbi:hypothetical protein PQE72_gp080 [Bacillus phage vB_BanS_Skywalker]|nr:hypothetical protein PQE72_gp080 [Bacillus phage vB_BanS_Skywalker]UGO51363.1 hypothetical protein SKYWALKER_206 [Bacillus phage vB_BanS_Skywalker]
MWWRSTRFRKEGCCIMTKPLFYTKHQLRRMAKRGMSKPIIEAVVQNGVWEKGNQPFSHLLEYKGIIVVLYEQRTQFNVSSCKLDRRHTILAEQIAKESNIDFWKAYHQVVRSIDLKVEIANI